VLTVTVKNTGDARAEVPVTAKAAQGEMSHRLLVPAKGTAVVRIRIPAAPTEAVVNDGSVPESDPSNNALKLTPPPSP